MELRHHPPDALLGFQAGRVAFCFRLHHPVGGHHPDIAQLSCSPAPGLLFLYGGKHRPDPAVNRVIHAAQRVELVPHAHGGPQGQRPEAFILQRGHVPQGAEVRPGLMEPAVHHGELAGIFVDVVGQNREMAVTPGFRGKGLNVHEIQAPALLPGGKRRAVV